MLVRKNKGNTLIETIVSMLILTSILIGVLNFYRVMRISEAEEIKEMKAVYQIDAVKKLILCNMSYDEVQDELVKKNKFISSSDLMEENLGRVDIKDIMNSKEEGYPLIMLTGDEEISEEIIKIKILYRFQSGREVSNEFCKGNYEKI